MNRELQIRRRIANSFNKREDDFPTLRDYNNYLEEVEDLIFNLVEGVDVQATEAKVAAYQEENAEQIVASRAKRAEEQASALRERQSGPPTAVSAAVEQAQTQGIQAAGSGAYAPSTVAGMFTQPRPTGTVGQPVPVGNPCLNGESIDDAAMVRRREEKGAKAGGWTSELGRKRALEEAFNSLWVN